MKNTLVSIFLDLLSIPSPSGKEEGVATYIQKFLEPLGYEVEEETSRFPGAGNLIVRSKQSGIRASKSNAGGLDRIGPILLVAHMDTVSVPDWEQIPVIVEGDVVHTGGRCPLGADDKAGVALALYLLKQASNCPQAYHPFEVLFTVREEQGCAGARAFDPSRLSASWGICLDGETPLGSAVIEAPTKLKYTIEVQGKSAHAALEPEKGLNAIKAAGSLLEALPTGVLDSSTTANIGLIEGGTSINVVPDQCLITGELRSRRKDRLHYWQAIIDTAVRLKDGAHLTWELMYEGYSLSPNAPMLQAFQRVCRKMGLEPRLLSSRGGGDANFFNARGIPMFVLGLEMEGIHTPQEKYRLTNLRKASELLETLLHEYNS